MRRLLLLGVLWVASAGAIDLGGEWRWHDGDDPRWAAPDFDDRDWPRVRLPARLDHRGGYWLRRQVTVTGTIADPAIALGTFVPAYEVFLDGRKIAVARAAWTGAYRTAHSFSAASAGPWTQGTQLTIALRVPTQTGSLEAFMLPDIGPYLLGSRDELAARVDLAELRHRYMLTFTVVAACLQLVFGLLMALFWETGTRRPELLWFAGVLLSYGLRNLLLLASAEWEISRQWPALMMISGLACLAASLATIAGRSTRMVWIGLAASVVSVLASLGTASTLWLAATLGALVVPIVALTLDLWGILRCEGLRGRCSSTSPPSSTTQWATGFPLGHWPPASCWGRFSFTCPPGSARSRALPSASS